MHEYLVTWAINLTADTPEDAAAQAHRIMLDPSSLATMFDVADECGATFEIDAADLPD